LIHRDRDSCEFLDSLGECSKYYQANLDYSLQSNEHFIGTLNFLEHSKYKVLSLLIHSPDSTIFIQLTFISD